MKQISGRMSRGNYCRGCEVRDEAERLMTRNVWGPERLPYFYSVQVVLFLFFTAGIMTTVAPLHLRLASRLARSNQSADAVYGVLVLLCLYHNL